MPHSFSSTAYPVPNIVASFRWGRFANRPAALNKWSRRIADVIVRESRSSIRMTPHAVEHEDLLPLGSSKFGGWPDLPPGYEWPRCDGFPLSFVAQINLADVAQYDVERLLPTTGILMFFFDHEHWFSTQWQPPEMWRVMYFAGDHRTLKRTVMPSPLPIMLDSWPHPPCFLTYAREITLPHCDSYNQWTRDLFKPVAPLTRDEINAYFDIQMRLSGIAGLKYHFPIHRMLGYADPVQNDLHEDDKILLLQVDTDGPPETDWGDTGRVYYFVDREALSKGDVSTIRFEVQDS